MLRWLGLGLLWAQSTCPHLRYILFDACGTNEGNSELLIFWSGSGFNTNDLRIHFPSNMGCNSPPWHNTNPTPNCRLNACDNALITSWNTACGGSVFQCAPNNTPIPANRWVLLFTGNPVGAPYPNPANLCGAGPIYVMFGSNNNGSHGRYLNNPTLSQNRATHIAFIGMPTCSMTVNYRNVTNPADGNYLLINPSICIGQTVGQNDTIPPTTSCYYASPNNQNGVSLGNVGRGCPLPGPGVLPILWAYATIEGKLLKWHATAARGEQMELWYAAEPEGPWRRIAEGLPPMGTYAIHLRGYYQLRPTYDRHPASSSPLVFYAGTAEPTPYPNPAPGGPWLSFPEQILHLNVYNLAGEKVLVQQAPIAADALRGLLPGSYLVQIFTAQGEKHHLVLVP